MNADELNLARDQLCDAVSKCQTPTCSPLNISPWVAMSLLQKSIRRGHEEFALQAAATLLQNTPERLWRRLGCIAFEDIGVADFETVSLITAALAGKRFRASLGGEWRVASYLVSRMVDALKCRAADDLLLAAATHPALERARSDLSYETTDKLIEIATSSIALPIRALALWYASGTDRRRAPRLIPKPGDSNAVFNALREGGIPQEVVEIGREGFRKTSEVLCPLVALLWTERQREMATTADDPFPPQMMVGELPCWVYDLYSREGRHALQTFLQADSATAQWVSARIPPRQRIHFLGTIVFRVEGGLCRQRLSWPTANELRRMVDFECNGPHCQNGSEILHLMHADLPKLNEVRSQCA